MIIECTNCHSKYQYNEERFEGKASKKIKCAKCATVFEIFNPALTPVASGGLAPSPVQPAPLPKPAPPASPAVQRAPTISNVPIGDQTFHKKPQPKQPEPEPFEQPQTGQRPAAGLQMPVGKRLSLAIIDGPDAGTVHRIEKPRVTVGRSGADIVLNDTESSRQHAAVEIRDTAYSVVDLGSTNGTLVNGEKITEPTELVDKGEFVVGGSTIMLIVTEEAT